MTILSAVIPSPFRGWRRPARRAGGMVRYAGIVALLLPLLLAACDGAEEREAAYFQRGKSLYEAGDYQKASLEFRNARQINPLNVEALYYLGMIAEKQGKPRAAYRAFQAVIDQKPTLSQRRSAADDS